MATNYETLDSIGEEAICERIQAGESQAEIAEDLRMSVGNMNRWLHLEPQRSARVKEAMSESAEGWLDRGLKELRIAMDPVAVTRARYIEQHCARRAAIRNPRYRESAKVEVSADASLAAMVEASFKRKKQDDDEPDGS